MTNAALLLLAVLAQDPAPKPSPLPPPDPYPPARHASVLRVYGLEGDLKAEPIRKALSELGTREAECRIAYGPVSVGSRKGRSFFAVEAPVAAAPKDVEKALKRGAEKVEELAFTCFEGEEREIPPYAGGPGDRSGWSPRDFVLGMTSGLRWYDRVGGTTQFYYLPGKVKSDEILDRYRKLVAPFGGGELGKVARESFSWALAVPLDEAAAKRAERAIGKLAGVVEARIDVATSVLRVVVELDALKVSGPGGPFAVTVEEAARFDPAGVPLRMRFDTNPVIDALEREKLALAPRKG